jgi:rubrerythrin
LQIIEILEKTFNSESNDIALYLAMSIKAENEGHTEIASYLYNVAMDEAKHAAEFALLLGKIKDTRTNLNVMLEGELRSEKDRADAAKIAHAEGHDEAFEFFEKSRHDETRHKAGLRLVISKLDEKD